MPGPPQPGVRMHVPAEQVVALLEHAERAVHGHLTANDGSYRGRVDLHRAEQVLLLTRLAADSGAQRGELAGLQLGDLDGAVLTIARGASNDVIGATKSGRVRRMTLGRTSTDLWRGSVQRWQAGPGPDRSGRGSSRRTRAMRRG